ncbi:TPR-like protein [Daldinia eschscholtzii]|nr:TPR-like protein [Daldinia eschscholtzii]
MTRGGNRLISPTRSPLEVLYPDPTDLPCEDTEIDIIAVHGLGSNVDWTWKWRDKTGQRPSVHWLRDPNMLPGLLPRARILVYNYESRWDSKAPRTRLQLCSESLIDDIHNVCKQSQRPIIFVGHSLGGLVVLYGLLYAEGEKTFQYIPRKTVGFVSLGTPFRGTRMWDIAKAIAKVMTPIGSFLGIIRDLGYDNSTLRDKVHAFVRLREKLSLPTCCFFEEFETNYGEKFRIPGLMKSMVVTEESACIPGWDRIQLATDHVQMNKYSGPYDSSFLRVSEEIKKMYYGAKHTIERRKQSSDEAHFMVPFGRNHGFVGREETLQFLLDRISPRADQDNCQRSAVEGLGGVGKSQLALEVAYRLHSKEPDLSVFWVPAVNQTTFDNAYRDIAQRLGLTGLNDDQTDIKALAKSALEKGSAGRWLFILDNADDVQLLFGGDDTKGLAEYLPFNRNGSIFVTTRTHEVSSRLDILPSDINTIEEMNNTEAFQLLQNGLSEDQLRDIKSVYKLLDLLAYLPLAIKQAASFMAKRGITATRYLDHCRTSNNALIDLLSKDFEDRNRYKDTPNPIATTWLISFEHISRDAPLAATYLQQLCFFGEKDIPRILLHEDSELEADEALGILKGYAFITEREEPNSFDMHRLVRLAMRNWIKEKGNRVKWITQGIEHLELQFPYPQYNKITAWIKYLPHAESASQFRHDAQNKTATCELLRKISVAYCTLGYYETAERIGQQALELAECNFGYNDLKTILAKTDLAYAFRFRGAYAKAENMCREVLQGCEGLLNDIDPTRLKVMSELALNIGSQGRFREGEEIHRHILKMNREVLGETHPDTTRSMINLADCLRYQGDHKTSEELLRHLLRTINESQIPRSIIAQTRTSLAETLVYQGNYSEAEEILQQERDILVTELGAKHPQTLHQKRRLAEILSCQERYEEAEMLYAEILIDARERMGAESIQVILCMAGVGRALNCQRKYETAEPICQQAFELAKKVLGERHLITISTSTVVARSLRGQGKFEDAELIFRRALELQMEILGSKHRDTIRTLRDLAAVLSNQRKYQEAELLFREALELRRNVLGEGHLDTINTLNDVAIILVNQKKHEEAGLLFREALVLKGKILGQEHPDTINMLYTVAITSCKQGKYTEAKTLCQQVVEVRKKILGEEHPDTLGAIRLLSGIQRHMGEVS